MEKSNLNELNILLSSIQNMDISSKEDTKNVKIKLVEVLNKLSEYNLNDETLLLNIFIIVAKMQGIDIVCNLDSKELLLQTNDNQIIRAECPKNNIVKIVEMLLSEFKNNSQLCQNPHFSSHTEVILLKK